MWNPINENSETQINSEWSPSIFIQLLRYLHELDYTSYHQQMDKHFSFINIDRYISKDFAFREHNFVKKPQMKHILKKHGFFFYRSDAKNITNDVNSYSFFPSLKTGRKTLVLSDDILLFLWHI